MSIDLENIRARFPALSITDNKLPRIYFDNPAGTQVPQSVIDAMNVCLVEANANVHGSFITSKHADDIVAGAHIAMADLLNAVSPDEIVFGQNMTTLTIHMSRCIGRLLKPGDEIILSRMDHDANVAPWLLLARDLDIEIRWLPFNTNTFEFDVDGLDGVLTERTRLVCVGAASNLLGTINDVRSIVEKAQGVGAMTYIDAVQAAPHLPIDVQDLGCDFLVCSAYKFFGPHQGILWGRREMLDRLDAFKVRPAPDHLPGRFETGTQSHEGMAGTTAAVDYLAWIGETMAGTRQGNYERFEGRRRDVHAALDCLFECEMGLAAHLVNGLKQLPGVRVQGVTDPEAMQRRVPTVSFTADGVSPDLVAAELGARNIFVWSGNMYALEPSRFLDLEEAGGVVRVGPVHYNSRAEIDTLLNALDDILPHANVA